MYEPKTRMPATSWPTNVSTVGKMENQRPIHVGIIFANIEISVVGTQ